MLPKRVTEGSLKKIDQVAIQMLILRKTDTALGYHEE